MVDEIGYLPITRTGAMLFFQLMSKRYERTSTVLTSNKSFEEWGEIFGDDVMAAAPIDRLVHHCHIVNIRGNSYRMRDHTELRSALHPQRDVSDRPDANRRRTRQEDLTHQAGPRKSGTFSTAETATFSAAVDTIPAR